MKRKTMPVRAAGLAIMTLLTGCFTASEVKPVFWVVEYQPTQPLKVAAPKYGPTRMSAVSVRMPYGECNLAVLRPNGSIAFDDLNEFAASPALLAKGVVSDALVASGLFQSVVGSSSLVPTENSVEVVIRRFALDCRKPGQRVAVVELEVRLRTKEHRVLHVRGAGSADAADGLFGAAFGKALSEALESALVRLK